MIAPIESTLPKLLFSIPEAAESCSVCERTISRLISRGELHAIKIGNRGVRVAVAELQRWIDKQVEVANG